MPTPNFIRSLTAILYISPPQFWRRDLLDTLGTLIAFWVLGYYMRRTIKKDLGRKATNEDLTSIDTWMKVDEIEHPEEPTRPGFQESTGDRRAEDKPIL